MVKPENLRVNLLAEPAAVPCCWQTFSWAISSDQPLTEQKEYRLQVRKPMEPTLAADTGFVQSGRSSGIEIASWEHPPEPDSVYLWRVAVRGDQGEEGVSDEAAFLTESAFMHAPAGIWHGEKPDLCILRASFRRPSRKVYKILANVTACSPEPARQYVYSLYVGGVFAGLGPPRYGKDAQGNSIVYYNGIDITPLVCTEENTVAALNYTRAEKSFFCEIRAYYEDGSSEALLSTADADRWEAADAAAVFRPSGSIGTGYYFAPAENFDAEALERLCWEPAEPAFLLPGTSVRPYPAEPVNRYEISPRKTGSLRDVDVFFVDFGKELVGGIGLEIDAPEAAEIIVRFGEELENGRVRYRMRTGNCYEETWRLKSGRNRLENTGMKTFRYVEFLNLPASPARIWGTAIRQEFDETASCFESSSALLNRIYDFTKYTVKATNQDLYVDSQSRERGAYEGDALINMLSAYAVEDRYALARFTALYLNTHRTWPAEYVLISILMAWEDYLYTGDASLLRSDYELLQGKLFPEKYADCRGLYGRGILQKGNVNAVLVDWPASERDGYAWEESEYNTVLNCMVYKALRCLSQIARVLNKTEDMQRMERRADELKASLISLLYAPEQGAFYDGLCADRTPARHFSQHASAFALYCGVYEGDEMRRALISFLKKQGKIKMSVYGAFYLLEGLYAAGAGDYAAELLLQEDTADGARTWAYMLEKGATITTEAWNPTNKPNMTFSHPWGSAPASQIVRGIFGIRPLEPGFGRFQVWIQAGPLRKASVTAPTVKGPVCVSFEKSEGAPEKLEVVLTVPPNTEAEVRSGADGSVVCRFSCGTHRFLLPA